MNQLLQHSGSLVIIVEQKEDWILQLGWEKCYLLHSRNILHNLAHVQGYVKWALVSWWTTLLCHSQF